MLRLNVSEEIVPIPEIICALQDSDYVEIPGKKKRKGESLFQINALGKRAMANHAKDDASMNTFYAFWRTISLCRSSRF